MRFGGNDRLPEVTFGPGKVEGDEIALDCLRQGLRRREVASRHRGGKFAASDEATRRVKDALRSLLLMVPNCRRQADDEVRHGPSGSKLVSVGISDGFAPVAARIFYAGRALGFR
jgi:hypothetical protein